jgi:polar amino acid transport system substrate-binding protein
MTFVKIVTASFAVLPVLASSLLLGVVLGTSALAQGTQPSPSAGASTTHFAVPNFRDPRRRLERPTGAAGTIRFLTSGDFPPFNFLDSRGQLTGFHVDLARAMCEALKATCTIQMRPFDELATALQERRGDAVIAGLAVTPRSRERLGFTEKYLALPGRFLVRRQEALGSGPPTPERFKGRWVAVVDRSTHAAFVMDLFPDARIAAYPDETAARDALRDGTVDAMFGDALSGSFWINGTSSQECCVFTPGVFLEPRYFGEGLRIAVAKDNQRLRTLLDYALQVVQDSGKYEELFLRYFPRGFF